VSRLLVAQRALTAPGWIKDALWRRAQAVPSLDLRFADNKSLADAVTGQSLVTFTRASSGTFVDSAGVLQTAATDVPRFDHDPTTGESLGLLVEEQRTNLRLNSATYQPTSGGTPAAYTVDQVAPDGTLTGSRQTAATPRTFEDYTGIANALYTFSFYCRVTSGTASFSIQLKNAATDTVITSDTSPVATTTWKRFSISGTTNGATPGARVEIVGVVPGFVFWGAQLEAGAFPTSYIPTTTAAATRSADVVSITGSAFSSWYRQDEGTVFVDGSTPAFTNTTGFVAINAAGNTNRLEIRQSRNTPNVTGASVDVIWTNINATPTLAANTSYKQATAVSNASHGNSIARSLDTSSTVIGTIAATQLFFGIRSSQTAPTGGSSSTIRRLTYWPQRLANSTLQSLTQ
jgi:hypothetical protein